MLHVMEEWLIVPSVSSTLEGSLGCTGQRSSPQPCLIPGVSLFSFCESWGRTELDVIQRLQTAGKTFLEWKCCLMQ